MIDHYKIDLSFDNSQSFRSNPGYPLYGCLMDMLPYELCEQMHENTKTPISQNIEYNNSNGTAVWNISSFNEELSKVLDKLFKEKQEFPIERDGIVLGLESLKRTHIDGFADMRKYSDEISGCQSMELKFLTTTALKKNGEFLIFPDLDLIIDNLWNQWNLVFPNNPLDDEEVLRLIKHLSQINTYNLSSSRYKMKGCSIRGFYGKLTVTNKLSSPLREILAVLFAFAGFNGVGVKNALGMGKTAVVLH